MIDGNKMKNIRILFKAYSNDNWMGGVYYVKNIVYQFLEYTKTDTNCLYETYIYIPKELEELFSFCKKNKNVHFIYEKKKPWSIGNGFIKRNIRELEWILRIYGHKIDYIYPSFSPKSIYDKKSIAWIPDFQHVYYPEFFPKEEISFRNDYFEQIAKKHSGLVLSSNDAYDTYKRLYPEELKNVGIVHFVSFIDIDELSGEIDSVLEKYGIKDRNYFMVANQFYRHKNHKTVIEAVRKAKECNGIDIKVICTGKTEDIKDPNYFSEIENMINNYDLKDDIIILGLIPRKDQLVLMRNSIAIVQPSLFEGWGTCTEDAKTLGKITLLSDIPVHREQADENSFLFDKDSDTELCELMCELWKKYYDSPKSYSYDIKNAISYGQQFADLLNRCEDSNER